MSRSNSPEPTQGVDLPDSADDGEYDDVVDAEGERTKGVEDPPLINNGKTFDLSASHDQEDIDWAYIQARPHIWQRKRGGWSARIPDGNRGMLNSEAGKDALGEIELCFHIRLTLHWHLKRAKSQSSRVQKQRELQIRKVTQQGSVENADWCQRLLWRHYKHQALNLNKMKALVEQCKSSELTESDIRLISRLVKRLQASVEHSFVGGSYLTPIILRYDDQDTSRYTVDKTCIFFSFPYFQVADSSFRDFNRRDEGHPPRTILQTRYRLNRTTDQDQYQCIRALNNATVDSCIEPKRREKDPKGRTKLLVFVPQLWGLIIGPDKLITYGSLGKRPLWGSVIDDENESEAWPAQNRLSFVRIFFYFQDRLEGLVYSISQCSSWFGLLNKQQQILSLIQPMDKKPPSTDYNFWTTDEAVISKESQYGDRGGQLLRQGKPLLTAVDWRLFLKESQSTEVIDIWLKNQGPPVNVSSPQGAQTNEPSPHQNVRHGTSDLMATKMITKAFFAWPVIDEAGELDDKVSLRDRIFRFLNEIYLQLPTITINEKRARTSVPAIRRPLDRDYGVYIAHKTLAQINERFAKPETRTDILKMISDLRFIICLFLPEEFSGADCNNISIQLYWGAAYEVIERIIDMNPVPSAVHEFTKILGRIVHDSGRLHDGVKCSRYERVPNGKYWREKEDISRSAVLLSAVVDAFRSIFRLLIAMVEHLRISESGGQFQPLKPKSEVVIYAREILTFISSARNQLISGADGRNSNDIIGPTLTPETLVLTLMERLNSAVHDNGTIDVIRMYEECLERLALQVKHEASRRLLQTINELQEEVEIVENVLKQQEHILCQLRYVLDPSTFQTTSIARRLRYGYECKNIERVLSIVGNQQSSCKELRKRAASLAAQNIQLVETRQDDNSKAIFIFTMVTVLFLPLSFVAGFFGMNFDSITNTKYTVWHFWEIALPLTVGVVFLCTIVGIKGEDTYFMFARLGRTIFEFLSYRGH